MEHIIGTLIKREQETASKTLTLEFLLVQRFVGDIIPVNITFPLMIKKLPNVGKEIEIRNLLSPNAIKRRDQTSLGILLIFPAVLVDGSSLLCPAFGPRFLRT